MASSVASKFNPAGHLHFFACPPTVVSIGNSKPEKKKTYVDYFPCFFKERFLSISFTTYTVLCCWLVLLCSGVLDQTQVLSLAFVAVSLCLHDCNKQGVIVGWSKHTSGREGETKIGKTCFISKPAIWAHCLSSENGLWVGQYTVSRLPC